MISLHEQSSRQLSNILLLAYRHKRNDSSLSEGAPIGTPEQEHLAQLPITAFTVRMNSLEYIRVQLTALSDIISRRYYSS